MQEPSQVGSGTDLCSLKIVHESGHISIWLQRGVPGIGLSTICIDDREAREACRHGLTIMMLPMRKVWRNSDAQDGTRQFATAIREPF